MASDFWIRGDPYSIGVDNFLIEGVGQNELPPDEIKEVADFAISGREDQTIHQDFELKLGQQGRASDGEHTMTLDCAARLDIHAGNVILLQIDLHMDANIAILGQLGLGDFSCEKSHTISGPVIWKLLRPSELSYHTYMGLRLWFEIAIDAYDPVVRISYSCRFKTRSYDENRVVKIKAMANILDYKVRWETAGTPLVVPSRDSALASDVETSDEEEGAVGGS